MIAEFLSSGFDVVVPFIFLLSVLIFVHELGHFAAAKACGVRVLKFSIGFGAPIGFGRYRMHWVRDAGGRHQLVVLPLHGRGNRGGTGENRTKVIAYSKLK